MIRSWIHKPQINKDDPESLFFNSIKDSCKIIFDVGAREDSIYLDFHGDVHYFEPVAEFLNNLEQQPRKNTNAFFNPFGLGESHQSLFYYPTYQSFFDRVKSCKISDEKNKMILTVKPASEYINANNIQHIDFVKIDTEGYEYNVLKGFGDSLHKVRILQFEYGGTYLDSNTTLRQVLDYLEQYGFTRFFYLKSEGLVPLVDRNDHYQYSNIVCLRAV